MGIGRTRCVLERDWRLIVSRYHFDAPSRRKRACKWV